MAIPHNYSGTYFTGLPIRATATIAKEGYVFSHWLETGDTTAVIEFISNSNATLTPIFKIEDIIDDVDDNPIEEVITLYPNPTTEELFVNAPGFTERVVSISIYNQLGQAVHWEKLNNSTENIHRIKPDNLPNGFYYFVLKSKDKNPLTKNFILRR